MLGPWLLLLLVLGSFAFVAVIFVTIAVAVGRSHRSKAIDAGVSKVDARRR